MQGKPYDNYRISLQSVNITGIPFEEYRVSLYFLLPFSIDIAKKIYGNPVNPCKHLQCASTLFDLNEIVKSWVSEKRVESIYARNTKNLTNMNLVFLAPWPPINGHFRAQNRYLSSFIEAKHILRYKWMWKPINCKSEERTRWYQLEYHSLLTLWTADVL